MDPEKPTVAEEVRLKRLLQFSNLLAGGAASTAARSSASSSSSTRATVGPSAAAGSAAPTVHGGYTLGASSSVGSSSAPPVAPFAGGSTLGASSSAGLSLAPPVPTSSGGYTLGASSSAGLSPATVPTSGSYTHRASSSSIGSPGSWARPEAFSTPICSPQRFSAEGCSLLGATVVVLTTEVNMPSTSCSAVSGPFVLVLRSSDSPDLSKFLQRLLQSTSAHPPAVEVPAARRHTNPGGAEAVNSTPLIIGSSSSDLEENLNQQPQSSARRNRQLHSTLPKGLSDESYSPESPPTKKRKRGPGRPKGSRNKQNKQMLKSCRQEEQSEKKGSKSECHICHDGTGGHFNVTDCGHLFHTDCLNRWLRASNQKYRSKKTCPYCGGSYEDVLPIFK